MKEKKRERERPRDCRTQKEGEKKAVFVNPVRS